MLQHIAVQASLAKRQIFIFSPIDYPVQDFEPGAMHWKSINISKIPQDFHCLCTNPSHLLLHNIQGEVSVAIFISSSLKYLFHRVTMRFKLFGWPYLMKKSERTFRPTLHYICEFDTTLPVIYSDSIIVVTDFTRLFKVRGKWTRNRKTLPWITVEFQIPRNTQNNTQAFCLKEASL